MADYDEDQIQAARQRQQAAYVRETSRLPEYTGIPELIGRAARLMRQRALAANTDDERRPYGNDRLDPVPESGWGKLVYNYLGGPIGEHCEALHPVVALAIADWLELGSNQFACVDLAPMVAVARAYLGEPDNSPNPICTGTVNECRVCEGIDCPPKPSAVDHA